MKFLHIIGSVVAFHAALFLLAGVLPGCRSTTRTSPSPQDTSAAQADGPQVSFPAVSSSVSPASSLVTSSSENFADNSSALPTIRFNPTRPRNPAAPSLAKPTTTDVTPASTYTVALKDSLWSIAKKFKISQSELAAANNLPIGATIRVGQKLIIPQKAPSTVVAETPRAVEGDTMNYEVRSGENLGQIAKRSGTTVAAIKKLNNLSSDQVRPGQKLVLPAGEANASALAITQPSAPAADPKTNVTHTVRAGESLDQIARKYGVRAAEIATLNRIANPNKLTAGKALTIPGVSVSATPFNAPGATEPAPVYAPAGPVSSGQLVTPAQPSLITPANDGLITPATPEPPPVVKVEDGLVTPGK